MPPAWPAGRYRGTIVSPWWLKPLGLIWRGKVFLNGTATNRIGPWLLFTGHVVGDRHDFRIVYHRWLEDTVWYESPGRYQGQMRLPGVVVRFTLEHVV